MGVNAVEFEQQYRSQAPSGSGGSMNEAPGGHTARGQRLLAERAECHKSSFKQ